MALTGTVQDFGIAEILQLIGQQAKSGVLHLESRDDEIHVGISGGYVVRAEAAGRKARDRLGSMMLRARAASPASSSTAPSRSSGARCAGWGTSWSTSGTSRESSSAR